MPSTVHSRKPNGSTRAAPTAPATATDVRKLYSVGASGHQRFGCAHDLAMVNRFVSPTASEKAIAAVHSDESDDVNSFAPGPSAECPSGARRNCAVACELRADSISRALHVIVPATGFGSVLVIVISAVSSLFATEGLMNTSEA